MILLSLYSGKIKVSSIEVKHDEYGNTTIVDVVYSAPWMWNKARFLLYLERHINEVCGCISAHMLGWADAMCKGYRVRYFIKSNTTHCN